jgi:hypothetical protein
VITQLSSFEGGQWRHGPLSNFYVEPDGTNVEAEYQGFAKTTDRDVQRRIAQMPAWRQRYEPCSGRGA